MSQSPTIEDLQREIKDLKELEDIEICLAKSIVSQAPGGTAWEDLLGMAIENRKFRKALELIKKDSDEFYAKWAPRLNDHPLLGFACQNSLVCENALK